MVTGPVRVDVRAYDVGFGDCILVSFTYAAPIDGRAVRHLLIDFGSNKYAPHGPDFGEVAALIKADTGGKLDVVALTHRHRDHLAGFDPAAGGEVIAALKPDAVLRSWTEVPGPRPPALSPDQNGLLDVLDAGHAFAARVKAIPFSGRRSDVDLGLIGLAGLQLRNDDAIALLDELAAGGKGHYLRYGDPLDLDALPGVKLRVLGPPDPDLWPAVRRQAAQSTEYWLGLGAAGPEAIAEQEKKAPLTVVGGTPDALADLLGPGNVRWIVDRLDDHQPRSTLRLVHTLDRVLNNTSLILLIEAAGRRMVFPGDAQIENWGYSLNGAPEHEANRALLGTIDLYKVGHHGSRNATPKESLFPLWAASPPLALMSTLTGVYDRTNDVPSQALVETLQASPFQLLRTDALVLPPDGQDVPVIHVTATADQPFTRVT